MSNRMKIRRKKSTRAEKLAELEALFEGRDHHVFDAATLEPVVAISDPVLAKKRARGAALFAGKPPGVHHVTYAHDGWCGALRTDQLADCTCNPDALPRAPTASELMTEAKLRAMQQLRRIAEETGAAVLFTDTID